MSEKNLDAISESGTYILDDDEKDTSSFKRYISSDKHRHGTFDIHGLFSSTSHEIHRPIVDGNLSGENLSLSTSTSSLLSLTDDQVKISVRSTTPTKQIKPPEAFSTISFNSLFIFFIIRFLVISPNLEKKCKHFPPAKFVCLICSISLVIRFILFRSNSTVSSVFQSLQIANDNQPTSNFTKSFHVRQPSKSTSIYVQHQTNRAVELRRARAQAKIEQLTQRTKKSSPMINSQHHQEKSFQLHSQRKSENLFSTRTISNPTEDLLDNGQRLAIKLIQLSSAILEKLK